MAQENPLILLEEQAQSASEQANYLLALTLYTQLLSERQNELGTEHPLLAPTLTELGEIEQTLAHETKAETFYRRALAICKATYGAADPRTVRATGDVGGILDAQGLYAEAQTFYKEAVQLSEQNAGPDHPNTALALANLARFYRVTGNAEQSEALFLRAIAVYESSTDPSVRYPLAVAFNNFAFLKISQKQYEQAEVLLRKAIQLNGTRMNHPSFAANLKNLASVLQGRGESAFARVLCQQAYTIFEAKLGRDHPDTQRVQEQLLALTLSEEE